jgi:hypothetical protein
MTKAAESVLADALGLDFDARAEVAAELLASLDGPLEPIDTISTQSTTHEQA